MALFPKIDQPCPLGIDEQRRIAGYCGHCSKAVHALNGMSDAERFDLLRNAGGPICVSYRVPMRRGVAAGLGAAALALSMAGPVHAADAPVAQAVVVDASAVGNPQMSEVPAQASPLAAVANAPADDGTKLETIMMTGGVSDPAGAAWTDSDDDVPELPMIAAKPAGQR